MKPIPPNSTIESALNAAYEQYKDADCGGANANYIPFLASVPADLFGIAAVTVRGDVFAVGDYKYEFAIESISKAFNLGLVMDKIGPAELRSKVGADPTGEPFNSVMAIELHHGKPLNPLVNAGAMATVSLVEGYTAEEKWKNMMTNFDGFAGRPLSVNDEVYKSESDTNQHNRGIAWLLESYGYFYGPVPENVDLYTRMCSIAVTAKDLALMGATYANGGKNPLTQKTIVSDSIIPAVLSELSMNGLYDSTGDWMYQNGVPSKSGVGGGLVAIIPGCMALAAFSPPLDPSGNSVKAQLALKDIISALNLNLFKA